MKKKLVAVLAMVLFMFGMSGSLTLSGTAMADSSSTATLTSFIQNGTVYNDAGSVANIATIVYSLGAAQDNLATWQNNTSGGIASDFLPDPQYFQTINWSGLSIAPGSSFSFSNLDIDLIVTLSPLNVVGSPLGGPETLRNASMSIFWNDGTSGSDNLVQQEWYNDQHLTINGNAAVPEPATMLLLVSGLVGLAGFRKRFIKK